MDRGPGTASGGSFISISENEQRCYSGLSTLCQADSSGKLAASKVGELFRASQLPAETLHQITDVCGAKRLGYFGSGQFYVALKLLAAAQAGLPVSLESIKEELPLPRFADMKDDRDPRYPNRSQSSDTPSQQSAAASEMDRGPVRHQGSVSERKEPWSPPPSPCKSPPDSPLTYHSYAYSTQRNGADAYLGQTPGVSAWAQVHQDTSSPIHYGAKPPVEHTSSRHSAERPVDHGIVDYPEDPWRITPEQREYYTNQFRSVQPDLGALILGSVARNFFTKSKLPIPELSHIWELSDMDRDGALTLAEFCTAFHLIVARKNGYPLPESLPPTLLPSFVEKDAAPPKLVSEDMFFGTSGAPQQSDLVLAERTEPLISFEEADPGPSLQEKNESEHKALLSEMITPKQDLAEELPQSAFSPKRAPVTTDQEKPPEHFHGAPEQGPPHEPEPHVRSRARPRSYSSTSIEDAMKKAEQPPTPPPRPQKSHSRASSLDLNRLFQQNTHGLTGLKSGYLPPPPALPPRPTATQISHVPPSTEQSSQKAVCQPNFADFDRFREEEMGLVQPPQKPLRRKYHPESQVRDPAQAFGSPAHPPGGNRPPQKLSSGQKKDIQLAIRKNKETNAVLMRLNSELQQQLQQQDDGKRTPPLPAFQSQPPNMTQGPGTEAEPPAAVVL
ncbi:ralBP1-associated Eps domain-containing protein 2 isoform X1 [Brienomyrus brachyistius]|uniref:ralBP1-associated Eps domain-containing protein 2 isoform X1 n=2 Tax=Brienomyrus brachyistius TaxID=42636 RepID=UPI0020B42A21|nr:ralBP1-associated Eps domain-containing protein 2 isoform X1 [Brienomyrus brachyistius]